VKYVAESIRRFGFNVPIVIDKDNTIVCGHTRWKASKQLKLKTVPCIMKDDLTDEQIRAYRLADNRVAEKAEWDLALLDTELAEIETIDMTLLGFDDSVGGAEPPQNLDDDEERQNIVITLNIKNQIDYETIKQKIAEIIDGLDVNMSVKMA
jgi:site-specific DNA-methyltransferase (adenine-specific)